MTDKCANHRFNEAAHSCSVCGQWFCNECLYFVNDKYICKSASCSKQYMQEIKKNALHGPSSQPKGSSYHRKTGILLSIFSLMNLFFAAENPADNIAAVTNPQTARVQMPGSAQAILAQNPIFTTLNQVSGTLDFFVTIDLFLAAIGIAVSIFLIIEHKLCRVVGSAYFFGVVVYMLIGGIMGIKLYSVLMDITTNSGLPLDLTFIRLFFYAGYFFLAILMVLFTRTGFRLLRSPLP
ncbi:MAG: hypothetical protein LWX56_13195 [Ignavibacteria bacterium]|nr:hypothetical protein [Ignavibacteria bacterium]